MPLATASASSFSVCSVDVERDLLAAGEDLVPAVLLVPLGERGRHVHLLDDVPPADARVVGAEADLALLRRIRNDAALGAAEVVVEQILEPHARDEQEVPAVRAALLDVGHRAVARDLAVVLARRAERLVELLQQVRQLEVRRRLERVVVLHAARAPCPTTDRNLPRAASLTFAMSLASCSAVEERRDRHGFLRFLVDHHGHADAAVRVAAAGQLAPVGRRAVHEVGPVAERAHERDREPVARSARRCPSGSSRRAPGATACSAAPAGARR